MDHCKNDQTHAPKHRIEILVESPSAMSVELTSLCNLKCPMCPLTAGSTSTSSNHGQIGEDVWASFLNAIEPGTERVMLTGYGEPTLHAAFPQVLRELDAKGVATSFTTNGISVSEELLNTIGTMRMLTHINVSVDTVNPEHYRSFRGGKLSKCLTNIGKLVAICGKRIHLSVSAVAMRSTFAELVDFPATLSGLGVKHFLVQSLHDQSQEGMSEHIASLDDREALLTALRDACDRHNVALHFELPERLLLEVQSPAQSEDTWLASATSRRSSRQCEIAWSMPHVDSSGKVFPCCRAAAVNEEQVGDLRAETLPQIWRGERYEDFRRRLSSVDEVPRVCSTCTVAPIGLPASAALKGQIVTADFEHSTRALRLAVRNVGTEIWTGNSSARVGSSAPRDRLSALATKKWLSHNRAASQIEASVQPGELAHFDIPLPRAPRLDGEAFQLVVDGRAWIPGTLFRITSTGRSCTNLATRLLWSVQTKLSRG